MIADLCSRDKEGNWKYFTQGYYLYTGMLPLHGDITFTQGYYLYTKDLLFTQGYYRVSHETWQLVNSLERLLP